MAFGRASKFTKDQLAQFQQHVLMHRDKTGRVPEPGDLAHIEKAIRTHDQIMEQDISHALNSSKMAENPDVYRILIEQQAVLRDIAKGSKKDKGISSETYEPYSLKANDIRDACSDRLKKLNDKVQDLKEHNQHITELDLRRQNDRGMGIDM